MDVNLIVLIMACLVPAMAMPGGATSLAESKVSTFNRGQPMSRGNKRGQAAIKISQEEASDRWVSSSPEMHPKELIRAEGISAQKANCFGSCLGDGNLVKERTLLPTGSGNGLTERQILLAFKQIISKDPYGALQNWTEDSNSLCQWNGITCDPASNSSVIAIDLAGKRLNGYISPALSSLVHLNSLNLSSNNFTGSIPSSLSNCSSLIQLDLSNNQLTGPVPSELGVLPHLQTLNLFYNELSGSIPRTIANCSALVVLALHGNHLGGTIPPQFGLLTDLQVLTLSFNHLSGVVPTSIFINCTRLTLLALSLNDLEGPIPSEIGRLKNLRRLWIDGNRFSGTVPSSLGNLSNLQLLMMNDNRFTGIVPSSLGRLSSLSTLFSISYNLLTGRIPAELGNMSSLNIMTLRTNFLTGSIPPELGRLKNLSGLFLEKNLLTGTIPVQLSECAGLQELRLDNNQLSGSIPPALGQLHLLTKLYLDTNKLEGTIPVSLSNLTRLQYLSMGYNELTGNIPSAVGGIATLIFNFSMPHNSLTGTIPPEIGKMIQVQKVDLSGNNFSGIIPATIAACVGLQELNLSHNLLTGQIPDQLRELKSLTKLDLSGNLFSGSIPASLSTLQFLMFLNVSSNNLTGIIPTSGVFRLLNSSSFDSNPGLCGPPLPSICAETRGRSLSLGGKIALIFTCVSIAVFLVLLLSFLCSTRKGQNSQIGRIIPSSTSFSSSQYPNLVRFTTRELVIASQGFSEDNVIGSGAVSTIYYGILTDGEVVAIKRFRMDNPDEIWQSFSAELKTLGVIRHRNLARILGFCNESKAQALVLEYFPQGSLERHLHKNNICTLSWDVRVQIAIGVAHGLAYLHNSCVKTIVHRDLKPSNVLLGSDMEAHLADFGIAKLLSSRNFGSNSTVRGTVGYLAPEYAESTRVTPMADVYSFGVLLLELMTRRRPTDEMFARAGISLRDWVGKAMEVMRVGLDCTETTPGDRPTMEMVVTRLVRLQNPNNISSSNTNNSRPRSTYPPNKLLLSFSFSATPSPSQILLPSSLTL